MRDSRALAEIRTFPQLIAYLRDELGWPITSDDFEEATFDYSPEELGIDSRSAAKIQEIKRLRPLTVDQPWGVFFVKFEPKRLPVVALRRILNAVAIRKRSSANHAERVAWGTEDLLFISNYGEGEQRQISFAHFAQDPQRETLPTLNVLGWDNLDTPLHIDHVADTLQRRLAWPSDDADIDAWREQWSSAFTLRHREVITTSKVLALRLAQLARVLRDRIRTILSVESADGPVTRLMKAFQEALIHDLDAGGFADTYAQTIAYGLLSARIANRDGVNTESAELPVTNPFLKELMETFLHIGGKQGEGGAGRDPIDFDELGVAEVARLLDDAKMEAVIRDFGDKNPQEDPVIHFYELFLKEYDAAKRMQRGVFYTPRPVVSYIVRSVDELLRTELGLEDGLADTTTWKEMTKRHVELTIPEDVDPGQPFVQILDPATGTGTFLVEAITLIHRRMVAKWTAQGETDARARELWNEYVPRHLLPRLHGYELLMAPYAIAHLKIGLKLHETGYRFGGNERARVYLTNALEPARDFSGRFEFAVPALAHEARSVNEIKRDQHFTVVIGNPPYSYMSANLTPAAADLIHPFRYVDGERIRERSALSLERSLQDDFVKFIGLAVSLRRRAGPAFVLGLITNNSYLDSPLHRGLRGELVRHFGRMYIANLFGDSIKDREENVFDIQQGVAVLLASVIGNGVTPRVYVGEVHGSREGKYAWLARDSWQTSEFVEVRPTPPQRYFLPLADADEYAEWPSLTEVFLLTSTCIKTLKDDLATDFDKHAAKEKVDFFRSEGTTRAEIAERFGVEDVVQWKVDRARRTIREVSLDNYMTQYQARPFDYRWMFYHPAIVGSPRFPVMRNLLRTANRALIANRRVRTGAPNHFWVTSRICVSEVISSADNSNCFPLYVLADEGGLGLDPVVASNFAPAFVARFASALGTQIRVGQHMPDGVSPEDVFNYIYAVFHSPTYRSRYSELLRIDFPRLPLPRKVEMFYRLGQIGGALVGVHLLESTSLKAAPITYVGPANPEVHRVGWSDDTVWLDAPTSKGQAPTRGTMGFRGVSLAVWNFRVGSYQVCEKWLKDRKGRALSADDIAQYQRLAAAIDETMGLMESVDEVININGGWPGAFSGVSAEGPTLQLPEPVLRKVAEHKVPPYGAEERQDA